MAISALHYQLLKEHAPLFKRGGSLLEIGEANWYGDMDPRDVFRDPVFEPTEETCFFKLAKCVYKQLFTPSHIDSIDFNGTERAFRFDLNAPLPLKRQYDIIINNGTAEHIFNIGQVFKSVHDACIVGGYMLHDGPVNGWVDHGFYTLQPTLFYDLAAANEYELVSLSILEIEHKNIVRVPSRDYLHQIAQFIPRGAIIHVVMRKVKNAAFRVPVQGYYDGRLSEKGKEAWEGAKV